MSSEVYLQLKETLNISKFAPHRHMLTSAHGHCPINKTNLFEHFNKQKKICYDFKSNAYPERGNTNFSDEPLNRN